MQNLTAFLFLIIFSSCAFSDKPNGEFKRILNNSNSKKDLKINFSGAYYAKEYYLENSVYFFENGLIYRENGRITDQFSYERNLSKYLPKNPNWGVYEIHGDTIVAHVYYNFPNMNAIGHWYLTIFQGILKNSDTIFDWHIIKPYPLFKKNVDKLYVNNSIIGSTNLNFKSIPFRSAFDSVAFSNVWVNKYRK
jgi:hypothetical protein